MWARMDDVLLIERYRSGFRDRAAPQILCNLLDELQKRDWAARVWAVTSHNSLRLTTAPDYRNEQSHPAVWLSCRGGSVTVSYFESGSRESQHYAVVSVEEAASTTDKYVVGRLLGAK